MATEREQTPRKLVYLRDHTPKPRGRPGRTERKTVPSAHPELAGEAAWLGRSLLAVAGGILVYWLLILTGAIRPEGQAAWNSVVSHSLAHVFLAFATGLAARLVLRGQARAPLFVALAAGALIVVAIEGLAQHVVGGDLSKISLAVRTDILTRAAMLAIGIWAASYALRTERRPAAA
ncbi:MAG: hypothetical protein AB1689_22935 [Thermodesulfobacteriota bacterium]